MLPEPKADEWSTDNQERLHRTRLFPKPTKEPEREDAAALIAEFLKNKTK